MSKNDHFDAITTVAKATLQTEDGVDTALETIANLVGVTLAQARRINLPAYAVQPAVKHLGGALAAAITAREEILAAHQAFGKLAERMGASPTSWGDLWPCPPLPGPNELQKLRPVPRAA